MIFFNCRLLQWLVLLKEKNQAAQQVRSKFWGLISFFCELLFNLKDTDITQSESVPASDRNQPGVITGSRRMQRQTEPNITVVARGPLL